MTVDHAATRRRAARRPRRGAHDGPRLLQGECVEAMAGMPEASVDAVVTDPPYGIDWQGESWDGRAIREAAGQAGPGRLTPNEAFEVWCRIWGEACLRTMKPGAHLLAFGSPRTWHRLTAGLEDAGFEIRDTLMWLYGTGMPKSRHYPGGRSVAMKPAFEPIVLARRPLEGTVDETLARHGTGTLNAAACQVHGRHPADVILGHDPGCEEERCAEGCPVAEADSTVRESGRGLEPSRFLYCPKVGRREREAGCEELPKKDVDLLPGRPPRWPAASNHHPTLKPIELMRWLVRLASPGCGLVLDPFMGSGTTGVAALLEGRRFCGIEREEEFTEIAAARIAHWGGRPDHGSRTGRDPLGGRR